jgi:hypothetical protein
MSPHLLVHPRVKADQPCRNPFFIMDAHIVDNHVDSLNINTATKDVGGNEDSLLESLELLESGNSIQE